MNETVSEHNMFTDDKSYEISNSDYTQARYSM